MNEVWVNRLIAGTKTWEEVPDSRKDGVKQVLIERVQKGEVTPEKYEEITGEEYSE